MLGAHFIWFGPQTAGRRQVGAWRVEVRFGPEGGRFDRLEGCVGRRVLKREREGHAVLERREVRGDRAGQELHRLLGHCRQFGTAALPLLGWPSLRMT